MASEFESGNLRADAAGGSGRATRLVDTVRNQAGRLVEQGFAKAADLAEDRKERAAAQLDAVVEVIQRFADTAEGQFGTATGGAARRGGEAIEALAQTLRRNSVGDMVDGSRSLVSRHPAIAIGAASVAGFLAGRIAKGGMNFGPAPARSPAAAREKTA